MSDNIEQNITIKELVTKTEVASTDFEKNNTEQDTALKTKASGTGIEFFFDSAKGCLAAKITK